MPFPAAGAPLARGPIALLLALVVALAGLAATPAPAAGATAVTSVEASLLAWTNRDRAALGLRPLRLDTRLAAIADRRASNLVVASLFSHAAAGGSLSAVLDVAGVEWRAWGENIGWWQGGVTGSTASALYTMWRRSPEHWANLMSTNFNYVGFGLEGRASDGRTFASTVFTESSDHTAPCAAFDRASRSGTTITFTWHGWDPVLQSHMAGVRDYDAWYRVDGGAWRLLRDDTTATSLRLTGRAPGHRYWLAVQPRDRVLNVGPRSSPISIWVP